MYPLLPIMHYSTTTYNVYGYTFNRIVFNINLKNIYTDII